MPPLQSSSDVAKGSSSTTLLPAGVSLERLCHYHRQWPDSNHREGCLTCPLRKWEELSHYNWVFCKISLEDQKLIFLAERTQRKQDHVGQSTQAKCLEVDMKLTAVCGNAWYVINRLIEFSSILLDTHSPGLRLVRKGQRVPCLCLLFRNHDHVAHSSLKAHTACVLDRAEARFVMMTQVPLVKTIRLDLHMGIAAQLRMTLVPFNR